MEKEQKEALNKMSKKNICEAGFHMRLIGMSMLGNQVVIKNSKKLVDARVDTENKKVDLWNSK